jgi:hypothetical protein
MLQTVWIGVYLYCLVLLTTSVIGAVTQAVGRYCQESSSPAFSRILVGAQVEDVQGRFEGKN